MTVGICTDSLAQLPPELADRFGVAVVPITVRVGDCEYLEGVDLGIDDFYGLLARSGTDAADSVSITHPSSGQFALAYDELAERGCTQILSIHASADASGTLNAARLAARCSPVPVRLVDSGSRSFGVSCAVWAAGDALAAGASLDDAVAVAESLAPDVRNVFVVGGLDLAGLGTASFGMGRDAPVAGGVPVLSYRAGEVVELDRVGTPADAVDAIVRHAIGGAGGGPLRAAVGTGTCAVGPLAEALFQRLDALPEVCEAIRFRVGPAVAIHTGPGTVACCTFPSTSWQASSSAT